MKISGAAALALVFFGAVTACSSDDSDGGGSATGPSATCRTRYSGDGANLLERGCACGKAATGNAEPVFPAKCRAANVGEASFCCSSSDGCGCLPVRCGFTAIGRPDYCGCQLGTFITGDAFDSCTGKGKTCCIKDADRGCYCDNRDSCEFGSYPTDTCDVSNITQKCEASEKLVAACE